MAARKDGMPRCDKGVPRKYFTIADKQAARKAQQSEAKKRYREKNKKILREKSKAYREANREACIERAKRWQRNNPDKARNAVYLRKYGISLDIYNEMLSKRDGRCDICKEIKPLVVDHCHLNGEIRGLLCDRCNVGIGCLEDNPDRMIAAAEYLTRYLATAINR